jgi:hypothetical protein
MAEASASTAIMVHLTLTEREARYLHGLLLQVWNTSEASDESPPDKRDRKAIWTALNAMLDKPNKASSS